MSHDLLDALLPLLRGDAAPEPGLSAEELAAGTRPAPPPEALWGRLERSLDVEPFSPFADQLASLFDLGAARVAEVLRELVDPARWEATMPGVELFHLVGGPQTAGADVGFVRVQPGTLFPTHRHGGPEDVLILQGCLRDSDGSEAGPGEQTQKAPGSEHHFTAMGDCETIFAVVVFGIEFVP